jgi:hypothetical protein
MDLLKENIRMFNPYRVKVPFFAWFYNTLCPMPKASLWDGHIYQFENSMD